MSESWSPPFLVSSASRDGAGGLGGPRRLGALGRASRGRGARGAALASAARRLRVGLLGRAPAPEERLVEGLLRLLEREREDRGEGLRDLRDVLLEEAAPHLLALGVGARAKMRAELATTLLDGELHLAQELVVVGDRLFGLARERHPHAREVDDDDHRRHRQAALGLLELVRLPVRVVDALADRARLRLVLEGHAVGEAHDLGAVVDR